MAETTRLRGSHTRHSRMADALRFLAMDAIEAARSGHPGMPMGMADVATILFDRHLRFDPADPDWPDRDRFVLSAGHGSMLLYGLLHLLGYRGMGLHDLRNFRALGAPCAGHPEFGHAPGIEATTGPLGQGLAMGVGMAIAERQLAARFGETLVDHRIWVMAGDGCLMEGVSQEALSLAGHLRLSRLAILWDDNGITIDGAVSLADSTDQLKRFEASGWRAERIDGHDGAAIDAALRRAREADRPSLIACRTTIGFGAPGKQGTASVHGAPLGAEEIASARAALDWPFPPFEIPEEIRRCWQEAASRGETHRESWKRRLALCDGAMRAAFEAALAGALPHGFSHAMAACKEALSRGIAPMATRKASERALEAINEACTQTLGGSADLSGSNNTKTPRLAPIDAASLDGPDPGAASPGDGATGVGRYLHYGIREHAMAAAMNGMALHGGVLPYGGTFLAFADYMKPAMRLSALMGLRVVYVLTHDSIGLGEDGPTHQPVEHLAMLRAMPNLTLFRPADAVETVECWECAIANQTGPSALALTRQPLPLLRARHEARNLCERGAYCLAPASATRQVSLLASGSEVAIALEARAMLEADGIGASVVSMPCWSLFESQPEAYRRAVLPEGGVRVAIEAGCRQGWDRFLSGERGNDRLSAFVGMEGFGASAPCSALYAHFGITASRVAKEAGGLLGA